MRKYISVLLLVLVLAVPAGGQIRVPSIIPGKSVDGVSLGMSFDEAARATFSPTSVTNMPLSEPITTRPD